jgi:hypothetical protein
MKHRSGFGIAAVLLGTSSLALAQQMPVQPAQCAVATNNCSVATQTGSNASATTTQGGTGNTAVVVQTVTRGAISTIEQPGSLNFAEVEQIDDGTARTAHQSTITQGGDENIAFVLQNEKGNSIGQLSEITQSGSDNYADVGQLGFADRSFVTQSSGSNSAIVLQGTVLNNGNLTTPNQFSTVIQAGTGGHIAVVTQEGASLNDSDVDQQGATNTANVRQLGSFQDSDLIQTGTGNMATTTQAGIGIFSASSNTAYVEQVGDFNQSTLTQGQSTFNNDARVTQLGDNGRSTLSQLGAPAFDNEATLDQLLGSSGAISLIEQFGSDNIADVTQGGTGDNSSISQTGNNNTANVSQNVP